MQRIHRALLRKRGPVSDGRYLQGRAFDPFFGHPRHAGIYHKAVDGALSQMLDGAPIPEKGLRVVARGFSSVGKKSFDAVMTGSHPGDPLQSSHVAIMGYFEDGELDPELTRDMAQDHSARAAFLSLPRSEIRIPLALLTDPDLPSRPFGTSWLYQIRFNTAAARRDGRIDATFSDMVGRGYVGVTSRPFVKRMIEHHMDMRMGRGHLLHSVWRDLAERGFPYRTIAQISAWDADADAIYALEEEVVGANTLAPLGLNMIPGGRNGIAMLKGMGFDGVTMETRNRILGEAIKSNVKGLPFYRRPHLRQYRPGCWTMVKGAWVRYSSLE